MQKRGKKMKAIFLQLGKIIASLSLMLTVFNVNSTCLFLAHQDKLPKEAEKLRKF